MEWGLVISLQRRDCSVQGRWCNLTTYGGLLGKYSNSSMSILKHLGFFKTRAQQPCFGAYWKLHVQFLKCHKELRYCAAEAPESLLSSESQHVFLPLICFNCHSNCDSTASREHKHLKLTLCDWNEGKCSFRSSFFWLPSLLCSEPSLSAHCHL